MDDMIDLGVGSDEKYGMVPTSMDDKRTVYPEFSYSGPKSLDLPDEGMMEIKFRKVSETKSVRPDGTERYECRVEVKCICDVESEGEEDEATEPKNADEALDILARALHEKD